MSSMFRSSSSVLHIENYNCALCHDPEGLRGSSYKHEGIDGEVVAICGQCYRRTRIIEKQKQEGVTV